MYIIISLSCFRSGWRRRASKLTLDVGTLTERDMVSVSAHGEPFVVATAETSPHKHIAMAEL